MIIPKQFKLLGQTIKVVFTDTPFIEKPDASGFASYRTNTIELRPKEKWRSKEQLEQCFCHELIHFILYHSGASYKARTDHMHQDEDFIDITSHLLHQALITMEGDLLNCEETNS